MAYKTLTMTHDTQGIATLMLAKPTIYNAFDEEMIAELLNAFTQLNNDKTIRAVILKAQGKYFCAGADVKWMQRTAIYSESENFQDARQLALLLKTLDELSKPTICVVEGPAYGGGLGLMACCDVVLALVDTQFCFSEVKLGLIPATISPYIINAIGLRQARRYFLSAETFNAVEAHAMGLIHELAYSQQELELKLHTIIEHFLKNGPEALSAVKKLLKEITKMPSTKIVDKTASWIARMRGTKEAQQGIDAFLHKHKTPWRCDE
jgi:methylglutaconyl-CoA hydratase